MAYEPKTWECGETITADALNHIEQGIANSGGGTEPLIFTVSIEHGVPCTGGAQDIYTYNLSWQEIYDALASHRLVLEVYNDVDESEDYAFASIDLVTSAQHNNEGYFVQGAAIENYKFADANSLEYRTQCTR